MSCTGPPQGRGTAWGGLEGVDPCEGPPDDELLDLRGALVQRGNAGVAEVLPARVLVDVAVAAVGLDAVVGRAHRGLRREELGLGGRQRVVLAAALEVGR